jgi:hypothetical protein
MVGNSEVLCPDERRPVMTHEMTLAISERWPLFVDA